MSGTNGRDQIYIPYHFTLASSPKDMALASADPAPVAVLFKATWLGVPTRTRGQPARVQFLACHSQL